MHLNLRLPDFRMQRQTTQLTDSNPLCSRWGRLSSSSSARCRDFASIDSSEGRRRARPGRRWGGSNCYCEWTTDEINVSTTIVQRLFTDHELTHRNRSTSPASAALDWLNPSTFYNCLSVLNSRNKLHHKLARNSLHSSRKVLKKKERSELIYVPMTCCHLL